MKATVAAAAAAMLFASPVVMSDSAEAGHRHHWADYDDGCEDDYCGDEDCGDSYCGDDERWDDHHWKPHHRPIVRKRHHRRVQREGVVIQIIVLPGPPHIPDAAAIAGKASSVPRKGAASKPPLE